MLSELLIKIANGTKLTPSEMEELRQLGREMDTNRINTTTWSNPQDKKISARHLDLPFVPLFSQVLEKNMASVILQIPSFYNTLLILGSGSITSANGGNIWAQFNGDTTVNYTWQFIKGDNTTVSSGADASDPYVALGVFGTTGAGAGVNGSFRAEIVHCQGAWKKNVLSHAYTAEFNDLYLLGSTWKSTNKIQSIEIFGTDNTLVKGTTNLASGSLISVYGMI